MDLLKQLRKANALRCAMFGHTIESWTLPEWGNAVAGEVGEMCNFIKKLTRGDRLEDPRRLQYFKENIGDEAADVIIYLDLLLQRAGIDLSEAIINKFNRKSAERGFDVYLKHIVSNSPSAGERRVKLIVGSQSTGKTKYLPNVIDGRPNIVFTYEFYNSTPLLKTIVDRHRKMLTSDYVLAFE